MTGNSIEALTHSGQDFRSSAELTADGVCFRLTGDPGMDSVDDIGKLLTKLHALATSTKVKAVSVNLRELQFMNSSCFKKFVTWINSVLELPQDQRYAIKLLSDSKVHWQKRSLHALQCFAPDLIAIES